MRLEKNDRIDSNAKLVADAVLSHLPVEAETGLLKNRRAPIAAYLEYDVLRLTRRRENRA